MPLLLYRVGTSTDKRRNLGRLLHIARAFGLYSAQLSTPSSPNYEDVACLSVAMGQ